VSAACLRQVADHVAKPARQRSLVTPRCAAKRRWFFPNSHYSAAKTARRDASPYLAYDQVFFENQAWVGRTVTVSR